MNIILMFDRGLMWFGKRVMLVTTFFGISPAVTVIVGIWFGWLVNFVGAIDKYQAINPAAGCLLYTYWARQTIEKIEQSASSGNLPSEGCFFPQCRILAHPIVSLTAFLMCGDSQSLTSWVGLGFLGIGLHYYLLANYNVSSKTRFKNWLKTVGRTPVLQPSV